MKISPVGTLNATPSLPLLGLAGKVLAGGVTSFARLGQKPAEMPEGTRTQNICSSSHHWWYHKTMVCSQSVPKSCLSFMQWCHVQSEQCLHNIVWRVFRCNSPELRTCVCVFFCWISRLPPSNPSKRDGWMCREFAGSSGGEALHFCTNVTAAPWIFLQWFFSKLGWYVNKHCWLYVRAYEICI